MWRHAAAGACWLVALVLGARVACAQVMDQIVPDDEGPVVFVDRAHLAEQRAEQRLALRLRRYGYLAASHRVWRNIASHPNHIERRAAMHGLAALAPVLAEGAGLGGDLTRFGLRELGRTSRHAIYLAGRAHFRGEDYAAAWERLERVPSSHPKFVSARLLMAVAAVQLGNLRDAARALRDALRSDNGAAHEDLVHISLARVFFHAGVRNAETSINVHALRRAAAYWDRVPQASSRYGRALVERAWLYHWAGDHSRALGLLHTVRAPQLEAEFHPEAEVLRALIHYTLCRYEDALNIASRLEVTLRAKLVQPFRATPDARMRGFAEHARRASRELYRLTLDERFSRDERAVVGALLRAAWREARDGHARRKRALVERKRRELTRHLRDAIKLQVDAINQQRRILESSGPRWTTLEAYSPGVFPDEEHVVWPFDGEYWSDELGTYRAIARSQCS